MMESNDRSGKISAGLAVAVAFLMAACAGDDASMRVVAQVDTIGGVVVVRNGTGRWRESERWRVVEEFRVGGSAWGENPDEELSYSSYASVTLGPNGRIFVIEFNADRVTVFSAEGEFMRSFGRLGEGPGEFRNPTAMAWDGTGRLWVADFDGRYHVFDATGAYRKTVRGFLRYFTRLQHPLVWEAAGTLVEEVGEEGGVLYVRVDTLGHLVDTAAVIPKPPESPTLRDRRPLPSWESFRFVNAHYAPLLRWSRTPDGMIWSATNGQLRLIQTTAGGDTVRIVETSHRPAELDAEDRAVIAAAFAESGLSGDDIELVRPVVDAIHVMDDGHVLVGIVEKVGEATSVFDVFDPEGFLLGSIDMGFVMSNRNLPALVGDTIIAVTPGDLDLPYLVRATIRRPR